MRMRMSRRRVFYACLAQRNQLTLPLACRHLSHNGLVWPSAYFANLYFLYNCHWDGEVGESGLRLRLRLGLTVKSNIHVSFGFGF